MFNNRIIKDLENEVAELKAKVRKLEDYLQIRLYTSSPKTSYIKWGEEGKE